MTFTILSLTAAYALVATLLAYLLLLSRLHWVFKAMATLATVALIPLTYPRRCAAAVRDLGCHPLLDPLSISLSPSLSPSRWPDVACPLRLRARRCAGPQTMAARPGEENVATL